MAVRIITAPPGTGKTFNMTRVALKEFDYQNPKKTIFFKKLFKRKVIYNNTIYSNYPIMLREFKKKVYWLDGAKNLHYTNKIYSNKIKLTDMRLKYKFCEEASFYIDEIQYMYDSQEYSAFPDCIAHFFQVHRHLSYNYIYTNSQSIARVIKKVLCVSEEYWNILSLNFYFGFLGRTKFRVTYDINTSKNNENMDVTSSEELVKKWFFTKRIFRAYDTKYLSSLNENLPIYNKGVWDNLKVTKKEILGGFLLSKAEKDELAKQDF